MTNYKSLHRLLPGKVVDLVPLSEEHTRDVIRLRNSPHVREYFDEKNPTTYESQTAFFHKYLAWPDDLYWAICAKNGKVVGTNRINELDGETGCKGSLTVDEEVKQLAPYALEADISMLKFAFDVLKLKAVRTVVRPDNGKMISFNAKLGFQKVRPYEMRGRWYDEYVLEKKAFVLGEFDSLIEYFVRRNVTAG